MSAGDLLYMEWVGEVTCPTPACGYDRNLGRITKKADVVDIGNRRFIICQQCGRHFGATGKTLEEIRATYEAA